MLCLVPDAGHVIPLTRIGRVLNGAGYSVFFIVPDELIALVQAGGFEAMGFGVVRPPGGEALIADVCNAKWQFQRRIRNRRLWSRYYAPLRENVLSRLDSVSALLDGRPPMAIVADDHLFQAELKALCGIKSVPLVLHSAMGSLYPWTPPFADLPVATRVAYRVQNFFADSYVWLRRRIRPNATRASVAPALANILREHIPGGDPTPSKAAVTRISTGVAPLELARLGSVVPTRARDVRFFGSLEPVVLDSLSEELEGWISCDQQRPIVFVSFGSMVPFSGALMGSLIAAASSIGVRLIMATKGSPPPLGIQVGKRDVYWGGWLPQVSVLAHPRVVAFVSHGGAGAVQESLWYGKPMLLVPQIWDQHYNARVATRMGYGIMLDRRRLQIRHIRGALSRVVFDASLRQRAAENGRALRNLRGGDKLMDAWAQILGSPE